MLEFARPRVGERTLDLGCGSGALALALAQVEPDHGAILGIDLSRPRLDQGVRNFALADLVHRRWFGPISVLHIATSF